MSVILLSGGSVEQPTKTQRLNVAANFCNIYCADGPYEQCEVAGQIAKFCPDDIHVYPFALV